MIKENNQLVIGESGTYTYTYEFENGGNTIKLYYPGSELFAAYTLTKS